METVTPPSAESQSPCSPAKKKRVAQLSSFLKSQIELQSKLGCDYALLWYERDAKSPSGQMPNYICIGDPIPVKLSHHVFMQMAFSILKDRLQKLPVRRASQNPGSPQKGELKKEETKQETKQETEQIPSAETKDNTTSMSPNDVTSPKSESPTSKGPKAREQDIVALFCFLWHYATNMMEAEEEALRKVSENSASQNENTPPPRPVVRMTKQQLRFQMLLEYGVDVHKVLGDGLPTANAVTEEYCKSLMADNITEEEFFNQLSKPARMAQVCSLM